MAGTQFSPLPPELLECAVFYDELNRMSSYQWDLFISHASEDKDTVARPLAERLGEKGVRVWLDANELTLGDSLRRKIDHGLALSQYGMVVLSPSFFNKDWPQNELNGLLALESGRGKVILPVWHGVDKDVIAAFSPLLADRLGISTSRGLEVVCDAVIDAMRKSAPAPSSPRLSSAPEATGRITANKKVQTHKAIINLARRYRWNALVLVVLIPLAALLTAVIVPVYGSDIGYYDADKISMPPVCTGHRIPKRVRVTVSLAGCFLGQSWEGCTAPADGKHMTLVLVREFFTHQQIEQVPWWRGDRGFTLQARPAEDYEVCVVPPQGTTGLGPKRDHADDLRISVHDVRSKATGSGESLLKRWLSWVYWLV